MGNSYREKYFPFLNKNQFQQPKDNKAKHFQAEISWVSEVVETRNLDSGIIPTQLELVNYIPQNCFEEICNELASETESSFDKELKKVVFSHVEIPDRLGKATVDELIQYKTAELEQVLSLLRKELHKVHLDIIEYERKLSEKHRDVMENQLKGKQSELDAFIKTRPPIVRKPRKKSKKSKDLDEKIEKIEKEREELTKQIDKLREEQETIAVQISELNKVVERFDLIQKQFRGMVRESEKILSEIKLDINELAKLELSKEPLEEKIKQLRKAKDLIDGKLNPSKSNNLIDKLSNLKTEIERIQEDLDEPNKRYQKYQEELRIWKEKKVEIVGKKNEPETLKYFEFQLKDLDKIPKKLDIRKTDRIRLIEEIHNEIERITNIYSELYGPVQEFISTHHLAKDKFNLNFDVSIINTNFHYRFFDLISRGVSGSFYGSDDGYQLLRDVIDKYDFSNKEETIEFVNEIIELLIIDKRTGEQSKVEDQLKKDRDLISLYDLIFSLEYLEPRYTLKMGDKELHELSPGEKGSLLLVFFLLIDKSDIPLIIDQPEHNLDNETIYDLLVPAIKEAKQKRQIIIVTHNPNIAVVCDADQVICASIEKMRGNKLEYCSGGIENYMVNNRIIEVLEGTRPAFDNREKKYSLSMDSGV